MDPAQVEEERRLAYVGITRAERQLYVTNAVTRTMYGRISAYMPAVSWPKSRRSSWKTTMQERHAPEPDDGGSGETACLHPDQARRIEPAQETRRHRYLRQRR